MVDNKKIKKVLAMFDAEDIPYINPKIRFKMITYPKVINNKKLKIKRVGEYSDRQR